MLGFTLMQIYVPKKPEYLSVERTVPYFCCYTHGDRPWNQNVKSTCEYNIVNDMNKKFKNIDEGVTYRKII